MAKVATRERILEAALEVFARKGYHRASVRRIPERSAPMAAFAIVLIIALLGISQAVSAQRHRIDLSDLANVVGLRDPQLSPDGKHVVMVVSHPDFAENRYENNLVVVEITTGAQRPMTHERPQVQHPRWSPGGDRLAFLDVDKEKMLQVFVMPMHGGDAKRITHAARGVSLFAWHPNGKEITFVTEDEPEKKPDEEKHNKSFEVGDNGYLAKQAARPAHLWLVSADGETVRRLTSGLEGVSTFFLRPIAWSPDGNSLAFISQPRPHTGEFIHGSIKILDLTTASLRTVVSGPPVAFSPRFSPDGQTLAYSRPVGPEPLFNPAAIFKVPATGGSAVVMTPDLDRHLTGEWTADGQSILVVGPDRTRISAWLQPVGGAPHKLDLGIVDPLSPLSIGRDGAVAFIGVEPKRPAELYYLRSIDAQPSRLTDFNAALASRDLGTVETITWKGPDGFDGNGVLVYPPDFDRSKKYPLVLEIHGGPMLTSIEGWGSVGTLRHTMAARGWIVFSPNYRGSNNIGRAYQRAVINDAGDGPGRDVMAGIAAVKARGIVDGDRIAVSGWSYGGFMTTWLIAHYRGWAAAVAGAAVTDWLDWYNLADLNVWSGYGLGGSPWLKNNAQGYRKQSPITYAPNIRTPTLILSNTDDPRVSITQSYKLYHALKDNGVPVQFIAYPISEHFPADPVHQRDVLRRWIGWIERHLGSSP
jgi:dipeptidyl aminopeptidase/acylaminoacyl peptidase